MTCPTCGRPGLEFRCGVPMPSLKARIFDAVKASGDIGLSSEEVMNIAYEGEKKCSLVTIKAHIFQINDLLAETDFCILSEWIAPREARWVLSRMKVGGPAPARFQYSASWRNVNRKKLLKLSQRGERKRRLKPSESREKEEDHGKRDQDDGT